MSDSSTSRSTAMKNGSPATAYADVRPSLCGPSTGELCRWRTVSATMSKRPATTADLALNRHGGQHEREVLEPPRSAISREGVVRRLAELSLAEHPLEPVGAPGLGASFDHRLNALSEACGRLSTTPRCVISKSGAWFSNRRSRPRGVQRRHYEIGAGAGTPIRDQDQQRGGGGAPPRDAAKPRSPPAQIASSSPGRRAASQRARSTARAS